MYQEETVTTRTLTCDHCQGEIDVEKRPVVPFVQLVAGSQDIIDLADGRAPTETVTLHLCDQCYLECFPKARFVRRRAEVDDKPLGVCCVVGCENPKPFAVRRCASCAQRA